MIDLKLTLRVPASLFSYVAFSDLYPNLDKLKANGVTVEYVSFHNLTFPFS
jgi:hypothetical protein